MIFHAGEFSASARDRPQVFHGKIETDVAVEIPDRLDRPDNLHARSRLAGLNRGRAQKPPAPMAYNRAHKSSGAVAVFQTTSRVHRERTSEYLLPVKSLPSPARKRIPATKNRLAPRRKDRHTHHDRSKPARAPLGALAVEEWGASRASRRWR